MEIMRSVARFRGLGNSWTLFPGLTPRALCCRALRALYQVSVRVFSCNPRLNFGIGSANSSEFYRVLK